MAKPKVLVLDIETSPIIAHIWKLWENNVALNQLTNDWHIMSWAAKWLDASEVLYADQRKARNIENDKQILKKLWRLLDQADIVVTQNGKEFDAKKLNARFVLNGMKPPSSFRHIDTKQIAKKHFAFTSNSLEYMSDKLNVKYKKLKHHEFPGLDLWRECLKGNIKAWDTMEKYNKHDVLATEELYYKLIPWAPTINHNVFHASESFICACGSSQYKRNGKQYSNAGVYYRYRCSKCGAESRSKENLLSKEKRKSLRTVAA